MNNDNFNEKLTPEESVEETAPEVTPENIPEVIPEPVPETPTEEAPAEPLTEEETAPAMEETAPAEDIPAETPVQEPIQQPAAPQQIPPQPNYGYYQQPQNPYPYGQPYQPQPYNPYNQNPYRPQQYPQQLPYQPYQPYGQPPAPKAKMPTGTKVFIICMCLLTVLGFGAFGISLALYGGNNASQAPEDSTAPSTPSYEDFYGDFFDRFEEFDPGTESSSGDGLTIKEPEQPDIKVPEVSEGIIINNKPTGPELSAEEVYNKVLPSTVTVDVDVFYSDGTQEDSTGTGIIISEDGFVITNSHVVANSKSVSVKVITSDGTEHPAVVVGLDKTTDLAVLKVDGTGFTPAEFGSSDELSIGQWVIAIGNPGGTEFTGSLTRGVISGVDRMVGSYSANGMTYIQTDAAINPGNSGGPLVNMYGQVIGINSSKIVADYYEGMGFAIPSNKAKNILDQLLEKGYVQGRVRLGITGQNVLYGTPQGVTIIAIDEPSSFAGTDAQTGDIITAVGGKTITGLTDLSNEFLKYAPGDTVKVTLYRPSTGTTFDIEVVLLEDKGETQR